VVRQLGHDLLGCERADARQGWVGEKRGPQALVEGTVDALPGDEDALGADRGGRRGCLLVELVWMDLYAKSAFRGTVLTPV